MRTVLLGEPEPAIADWLERRRALGQDLFDEMWEGEYHVAPAPHGRHGQVDFQLARVLGPLADAAALRGSGPCNIGTPSDYRVPDQAYFRDTPASTFHETAALVVEIVSPGDESREKFGFYHRAQVEEVLIVDPELRSVEWFVRGTGGFLPSPSSTLLGTDAAEVARSIDWPR